ncbi:hypothetical protein ABEF95_006852 [Exophiala dermatitidis]
MQAHILIELKDAGYRRRRSDRRSGRKASTTTEGGALRGTETSQTSKIATLEILGSPSSSQDDEANKENYTGKATEPRRELSAARARDAVGLRERTPQFADSIPSVNTPALRLSTNRGGVGDLHVWEDNEQHGSNNGTPPVPDESTNRPLPSAGSSKPKRRKKRKSVILVRKKRRSSGPGENQPGQTEVPIREPDTQASPAPPTGVLTLPPASRRQTRNSLKKDLRANIGGSPSVSGTPPPKQMEEDGDETYNKESSVELTTPAPTKQTEEGDDDDESYIQESSPEPTTPATTKRIKRTSKGGRRRTSSKRDALPPKKAHSKTRFPFLTHRLTNLSRLPPIHETNEDGKHGDDPLDMTNDRGQPNVVDVLAQICRETIENLIEGTSTSRPLSDRAAMKTKRDALEAFGRDLDDELFELSEVVENRIQLEARVRKSRREKASLQAEWLALRKERERIALECDAVRREHWECEDDARQRWNLSEAAKRAEIELSRETHSAEKGIEFLLRSVASNVSSASAEGGLLDKVKRFNAQLESMALLLENKRVN